MKTIKTIPFLAGLAVVLATSSLHAGFEGASLFDSTPKYPALSGADSSPKATPKSAVPEPTTIIAGALLLLPFGVSTVRILRRNKSA